MTNTAINLNDAEAAWDSESRLSPYCTVWSPEQDDDAAWQADYDSALARGLSDTEATEYADSRA